MSESKHTEADIAAKAIVLLEEQLKELTGTDKDWAQTALRRAKEECEREDEEAKYDLDIIWRELEDCWRKGSTPADVIQRLYDAACHYRELSRQELTPKLEAV